MATLVTFHAHPDDEAIATGGTMAKTAEARHRVVLVTATRGEHGEVEDGFLAPGEPLWRRRAQEVAEAGQILGASRVECLGYVDSGMMGTPENDAPRSFWGADVEEAAARLAAILVEERADVLTVYDHRGGYGHPDHIQVHRVGVRAAELAGTPDVFEATQNRDDIQRLLAAARAALPDSDDMALQEDFDLGVPESVLTTAVDVRPWLEVKRRAMRAHASQISETSFFLSMPDDVFAESFGTEWYIHRGVTPGGPLETDLFPAAP